MPDAPSAIGDAALNQDWDCILMPEAHPHSDCRGLEPRLDRDSNAGCALSHK